MGLVLQFRVLRGFFFLIFLFSFFSCDGLPDDPKDWREADPLYKIYQNDFLLGNVISFPRDLEDDRFILLKRHFNTVTPENDMKPENIAPRNKPAAGDPWVYTFNNADNIVDTARVNGMNVVGHTLIWHSQTPSWLTKNDNGTSLTKETALYNLNKYVTDVAGHFQGKLIAWDVVNEAMRESKYITAVQATNWKDCLREEDLSDQPGSPWNRAIGSDYIEKAFVAARDADPAAKRYYNDYNLNNANKARAVYNMVKDINGRYPQTGGRLLIEGIGMQSHHHLGTDPLTVDESIELFASLGVEVAISELDIIAAGNLLSGSPAWNETAAENQAKKYAAMFKVFIKHSSKISRVTFWGIDDGTHWRTLDGSDAHAALLDAKLGLKPAFFAVMDPSRYDD